ncbi:AraC family transcriptional regulator [Paenibacillus selenitireducens]|uniref:AraC family transcriptional regulator n=1 Tax=Paenibacillus selenitireducens TaxID=1324314 RepID=A0A1T2X2K6_9BACL|nr:AraC family transcriptional regulator [Paenibacillus selenitireducens]OPA73956.1 AraC family transcriptional regulator [Paenibacillus selenitireducens]
MEPIQKQEGFVKEKLFILPEYMSDELQQGELTRSLYISDIGYFPHAQYHYRERPEGCDSHIVICCAEGEGWIETHGDRVELMRQHLMVIPAGTPHRYGASSQQPWSIYWFHIQGEHAAALIHLFGMDAGPLQLSISTFTHFTELFNQCYDILSDKSYAISAHVHAAQTMRHLLSSIGMSSSRSGQDQKSERYLEYAIRYMTEHMNETIKLDELAKHIGLSKQHLIYTFNRETGFAPIDYFLRMKMQRAGQMLDLTDLSIKEVAGSIGMTDPYYFSRLFKKITGHSPTDYRNIPKG